MPHDFDYVTGYRRGNLGDNTNADEPDHLTLGPDSDEIWDILDVYVQLQADHSGAPSQFTRAAVFWQLHTGAPTLLDPADLTGTNGFGPAEDHRILDIWSGHATAAEEDDTNGTGAGTHPFEVTAHLRFDPGDLRISFPGELQLGFVGNNSFGGGAVNLDVIESVGVHYKPSPRHG